MVCGIWDCCSDDSQLTEVGLNSAGDDRCISNFVTTESGQMIAERVSGAVVQRGAGVQRSRFAGLQVYKGAKVERFSRGAEVQVHVQVL